MKIMEKGNVTDLVIEPDVGIIDVSYSFALGELTLLVKYNQTIEGNKAKLAFTLRDVFYIPYTFFVQFVMKSQG